MDIANRPAAAPAEGASFRHAATQGSPSRRLRSRGLVIAAALTAGVVVLAVWQRWLTLAELTPLLFTLPCAVMMFMCMKGMNHAEETGGAQTSINSDKSTGTGATLG